MPSSEFFGLGADFVTIPTDGWLVSFTEKIDFAASTIDLVDWAINDGSDFITPTGILFFPVPGKILLQNPVYTDQDERVRYTGPVGKVVSTEGSFLIPFDLPI